MKTRENERRDSGIIIILILLLGFVCIILASGWALRFAPSWKLGTNMGSNLNPNSDFLTSRPVSFIEPLDPSILTNPAWMDVFLTPGAVFPTRTPLPTSTAALVSVKTSTPLPTLTSTPTSVVVIIVSPTNTKATSVIASPTATNTPVPPLPSANLQISKSDGVATISTGGTTMYTVRVTNLGPSNVTGAILGDPLAIGLSKTVVACSATPGQCVTAPTIGQLEAGTFTLPALANGQFYEITITANVTALSGSVTNTATITAPVGTLDPTPGNNTASDIDTVTPMANLAITKSDGVATISTGGTTMYTMRVTNTGPSSVTGAILGDSLAIGLNKTIVACSATPGQCVTAPTIAQLEAGAFPLPTLASGQFYEITVTANVTALSGSVTNTAIVTTPVGTVDPTPANNTASDTDMVISMADLAITKSDGVATISTGVATMYTMRVTNTGPSSVTGAILDDPSTLGLNKTIVVCSATPGQCVTAPTIGQLEAGTFTLPALANGQFYEITITANVTALSGSVTNTATITTPVGTLDPTPGNNTASDTDTVMPMTDLAITKSDGLLTYISGNTITYTIVVTNTGPSNAIGASVADTIPAAITGTAINCAASGTASCGVDASAGNALSYIGVNIPVGAGNFLTITASGTVNPATTGNLVNTATVTVGAGQTDPNASNNTATDTDAPTLADLSITKTDNIPDYTAGTSIQYSIVVSNLTGPSNIIGATVLDTFSANLDPGSITWTCAGAGGASCTTIGAGNINDTLVNLPVGSSATYTVNATAIPAPNGDLVNTATVSVPVGITDPNPGNNDATDTDIFIDAVPSEIGTTPDNTAIDITPGSYITLRLGTPITWDGNPDYDLVYYEFPNGPGIFMDWVIIQIGDGVNWYTVLNWGDEIPDTNSNIDISGVLGGTEADNRPIASASLYNTTGVAMDIDAVAFSGTYYYIRIYSPVGGNNDGSQVDAIEILP